MPFRRKLSTVITVLLILVAAASVLQSGCAPKLPPEPTWEQDASALLDQAEGFASKHQYVQATGTLNDFFARYPKSRHGDRALYLMGQIRLTERNYRQALSYYKDIIERYPASPFIADAKFKLGQCYYELKEYDLAVANLEDRSKISDPLKRRQASEMLASSYVVKRNYPLALREYVFLANNSPSERQAGYRDRVREIVDKNLTADELKSVAAESAYPSDLALLRLCEIQIEQRKYRDATNTANEFQNRFPNHPEKARGAMLLNEATTKLSAPRYSVGVLVPQSGQLAFFGDRILKGLRLAVNVYNVQDPDNRVELLVKDTEGASDKAVAGVNELAAKGIVAGIGPITTREEEAIAPVLDILHIPFIKPAASRAGALKSSWIFRNALTIDSQAQAAADYAVSQKFMKLVIFYPDEPYGRDLFHLFARNLERKAEVLASIPYPPETKDFGPYIRKLMEIDLRSRKIVIPDEDAARKKLFAEYVPSFDALYLPGYAERVGLLIPQLAFYNISKIPMIGSDNWHSPALIERAGRHADGAVFVDGFFPESADPAVKAFVETYRSAYQEDADILSAQAFDAGMMIFSQLKERKETPLAIRDGLLAIKEYPGITGSATFAGSQEAQKKLFLIRIGDGKFTLLPAQNKPQ